MKMKTGCVCNLLTRGLWLIGALNLWVLAAFAAEDQELTAQALLFDAPYMSRLSPPNALIYNYRHGTQDEATYGAAFSDQVRLKLEQNPTDGSQNAVTFEIFTGPRQRVLGPHYDLTGNPIIMVFLERDLWEMRRRIGGAPVYYRNKIRKALRDTAVIEETQARVDGRNVPAKRITITPFIADQDRPRLKQYYLKTYEFTVAEGVPGGYVSITSKVPEGPKSADFIVKDELVFIGQEVVE